MTTYAAWDITVLNLSHSPDSTGIIIPPEAFITFPKNIKVIYGDHAREHKAGDASLRRVGNSLVANITMKSTMKNKDKAMSMISNLFPAVSFAVLEAHENIILRLKIEELFLTPYNNDDLNILPLGDRVILIPLKSELH